MSKGRGWKERGTLRCQRPTDGGAERGGNPRGEQERGEDRARRVSAATVGISVLTPRQGAVTDVLAQGGDMDFSFQKDHSGCGVDIISEVVKGRSRETQWGILEVVWVRNDSQSGTFVVEMGSGHI